MGVRMNRPTGATNSIQIGIIGFGFMGRTHARAYQSAHRDGHRCKVLAIADRNIQSINDGQTSGNIGDPENEIDTAGIELYEDADAIINHPALDLVSICTHTDTHVELAIAALKAGKHVLIEKPIATHPEEVQRLASAAALFEHLCIPAMCMRHWPAWVQIRELIRSHRYGSVRSAVFHRLGSRPKWSADFYADDSRSGGVLYDLHIHDTDFIVHCFGKPAAVTTSGDGLHLTTLYHYPAAPIHVTAQAAWDHQPAAGFQMRCAVVCDQATIDFDFNRDDQLIIHEGDQSTPIQTSPLTGYDGEIRWMLDQIANQAEDCTAPILDAVIVAKVLDAEQRSMIQRASVSIR